MLFYIVEKGAKKIKPFVYENIPFEPFIIDPIIPLRYGIIDISVTNMLIILILLILGIIILGLVLIFDRNFTIIPSYWQAFIEKVHLITLEFLDGNIPHQRAEHFFPWVYTIFVFLLSLNIIGLFPYIFSPTSHLIVTFTIATGAFFGTNYVALHKHGLKLFRLFLPEGSHFAMAFLLVPIEFISYFFRPISLSIRLFANVMSGHTLINVLAGFVIAICGVQGLAYITIATGSTVVLVFVLAIFFALEAVVSLIQAYVFAVLISIYINDALSLH